MKIYHCNQCSNRNAMLYPVSSNLNLTGSLYQENKFVKHTMWPSTPSYEVVSVFCDTTYGAYQNNIVSASIYGSIEVDTRWRTNVVWVAPTHVGYALKNNVIIERHNAIKLVLHTDINKVHAYSIDHKQFLYKLCIKCGSFAV